MSWPTLSRCSFVLFFLLLVGAGGVRLEKRLAPADLPGLLVDGVVIPPGVAPQTFVAARADARLHRRVRLTLEGQDVAGLGTGFDAADHTVSLGELGVTVDEDRVVQRVLEERRTGVWFDRLERAQRASRGEINVPLAPRVNEAVARPILEHIKEWTDRSPVSARLDLDRHQVVGEKAGMYVDLQGALSAIARAADEPGSDAITRDVVIPTRSFPPHVSKAFVENVDVNVVLAEYSTGFSRAGDQARRGKNIDVAASKIDGLVIAPGELVSFNAIVGERSEDNGFQKSWEIFKGEMVEGVGGGTCQVASTFYAAVFFGGLEITERLPHSRPSAYIPLGLDATVVYPIVDLKVRNPYDFAVVVHAKVTGNQLKMQLLGAKKPAKVSFTRELVASFAYPRKVNFESKLRFSKRVVLKQHGIRGFKIKRTRTMIYKNGTKKKEENIDLYPATAEIYDVPPDFDVDDLPPLPEDNVDQLEGGEDAVATATGPRTDTAPATKDGAAKNGVNPPAAVPGAPVPVSLAVPCKEDCGKPLAVMEGPGAHMPTEAQAKPAKTFTITR